MKKGAVRQSQAGSYAQGMLKELPRRFVFDKPFLLYLKQKGRPYPCFALWAENAELMRAAPPDVKAAGRKTASDPDSAVVTPVPTPTPPPAPPAQPAVATLDGKKLVAQRCTVCHNQTRINKAKSGRAKWEATVSRMIGHGAKLDPTEREAIIDYLAGR